MISPSFFLRSVKCQSSFSLGNITVGNTNLTEIKLNISCITLYSPQRQPDVTLSFQQGEVVQRLQVSLFTV